MKSIFTVRNVIYGILIAIVGMQFLRIDQSNPPVEDRKQFSTVTGVPEDVNAILVTACYDCHSFETVYPWYSNIAPFSWIIGDHVHVAREEMNFSVWADYSVKKQDHKLEEIIEEIEKGEMPLPGYVRFHSGANLSEEQKEQLFSWINTYRATLEVPE